MENTPISELLDALKHPDESIRQQATDHLWRLWFQQKGIHGTRQLMRSQTLLDAGQADQAEALLSEILQGQPDFAEAWNRRAVLYFVQGRYDAAIADCERAIALVPYHFGALHGLGLCHMAQANYAAAIRAFRLALEVQPYALVNQRLILECTAQLS